MQHNEKNLEIVRKSVLIGSLPEETAQEVLEASSWQHLERGETIFLQGEPASAIHIVADGWVKLYRIAPNGTEAVVSVITRGQGFGEAVAFRGQPYPVSAEAVTECTLLQVPAAALVAMMRERPEICLSVLASVFQHLHGLVTDVEHLKAQTGAQRVAEFLLELTDGESGACTVILPYDKVLIAGRLGIKPESLSRAFAKLRGLGVIIKRNHAAISDIEALRRFAEEDPAASWGKAL